MKPQRSFDEYEVEPSAEVWDRIEKRLPPVEQKKRGWIYWSAAASVLIAVYFSASLFDIQITLKEKGNMEPSQVQSNDLAAGDKKIQEAGGRNEGSSELRTNQFTPASENRNRNSADQETSAAMHSSAQLQWSRDSEVLPGKATTAETSANMIRGEGIIHLLDARKTALLNMPLPGYEITSPVITESLVPSKRHSVSRWQFSVIGTVNSYYRKLELSSDERGSLTDEEKNYLENNEDGIRTFSYDAHAGYSVNTHFNVVAGINYFTVGQKRNQSDVYLASMNLAQSTANYSINTSLGNVSGEANQFNQAYYHSPDSVLYTLSASNFVGSGQPKTVDFELEQKFSFVSVPVLVQYQAAERRFTPYIGLGLSAGWIVKRTVTVNDKTIDYEYPDQISSTLFTAEAQAGIKYSIKKHLSVKLQPSFRYGLNSLTTNESVKWIPYSLGFGFGVSYRY